MQQIILRKTKEENGIKVIEEKILHTIEEPSIEENEYTIGFPVVMKPATKDEEIVPVEIEKPITFPPYRNNIVPKKPWEAPSTRFGIKREGYVDIKTEPMTINEQTSGRQKLDSLGLKSGSPDRIKLNPEKVREMRRLNADRMPLEAIAEKFGVSKSTAYAAINYISWSHVE